jgi:hypothetical protein
MGIQMNPPSNSNWDLTAQHEFLAKGLARGAGKGIVAKHVEDWWDAALGAGIPLKPILWEAICAAYYSGVVTMESFDMEEKGGQLKALFFAKDLEELLKIVDQDSAPSTPSPSTPAVIAASEGV